MSFPYAAIANFGNSRSESKAWVPVAHDVAQASATTALAAAARMRERNLQRAVANRLARAKRRNEHWWAVGPLRMTESVESIARDILEASPFDDETWLLLDMPVRLLENAAREILSTPARRDGCIFADGLAWQLVEVYRPSGRAAAPRAA